MAGWRAGSAAHRSHLITLAGGPGGPGALGTLILAGCGQGAA